jgi:predicted transcriptional regulator
MKKSLIDVLFMSEKRKGVLLLLQDGAKEMEVLLRSLDTTRQALLPQIRTLEEHHLVSHDKDIYELTTIGKLIVDDMNPLLGIVDVFDTDINYWGTHDLAFIPPHLLERIDELGECRIMSPSTEKMYEAHHEFNQESKKQKSQFSITTFFYPNFPDIFSELLSNDVNMYVIISQSLFDKLRSDSYINFKRLIGNKLVHFYVYSRKMEFLSFVFNESTLMMSPLKVNNEFDNRHVLCEDPGAIQWAKELFEYYLKHSVLITEI